MLAPMPPAGRDEHSRTRQSQQDGAADPNALASLHASLPPQWGLYYQQLPGATRHAAYNMQEVHSAAGAAVASTKVNTPSAVVRTSIIRHVFCEHL